MKKILLALLVLSAPPAPAQGLPALTPPLVLELTRLGELPNPDIKERKSFLILAPDQHAVTISPYGTVDHATYEIEGNSITVSSLGEWKIRHSYTLSSTPEGLRVSELSNITMAGEEPKPSLHSATLRPFNLLSGAPYRIRTAEGLVISTEPKTWRNQAPVLGRGWKSHHGFLTMDPGKLAVEGGGSRVGELKLGRLEQLYSVSADGQHALVRSMSVLEREREWVRSYFLVHLPSGKRRPLDLGYSSLKARFGYEHNENASRLHPLSKLGEGGRRDRKLLEGRIFFGLVLDSYQADGTVQVFDTSGNRLMACPMTSLDKSRVTAEHLRRYGFLGGYPILSDDGTTVSSQVAEGLQLRISLLSRQFVVAEYKTGAALASGSCE